MSRLRIGTRSSLLALTQTRWVISQLKAIHPSLEVEEVLITTEGDLSTTPLSQAKSPGVFVSALRDALVNGEVDAVVHSMKDLPAHPSPNLRIAAVPTREDPRDVLVTRDGSKLTDLKAGAVVGTSSPRRAATLRQLRPDLTLISIRGNIDTRISKVMEGTVDATVLALAGLNRIGRSDVANEIFPTDTMIPAPGQGALAIETRANDEQLATVLSVIDSAVDRLSTTAERAVLRGLGASCATAIGASATFDGALLSLVAELAVEESGESCRVTRTVKCEPHALDTAERLGLALARELLASEISHKAALK